MAPDRLKLAEEWLQIVEDGFQIAEDEARLCSDRRRRANVVKCEENHRNIKVFMARGGPREGQSRPQGRPKMAPRRLQIGFRWPQRAPDPFKLADKSLQIAEDGLQIAEDEARSC